MLNMMGFSQRKVCLYNVIMLTIMFILLATKFDAIEAIMRPLKEEQNGLLFVSLPKGPVPPSNASPCTHIPKSGGKGRCTMEVDSGGGGKQRDKAAKNQMYDNAIHFEPSSNYIVKGDKVLPRA